MPAVVEALEEVAAIVEAPAPHLDHLEDLLEGAEAAHIVAEFPAEGARSIRPM